MRLSKRSREPSSGRAVTERLTRSSCLSARRTLPGGADEEDFGSPSARAIWQTCGARLRRNAPGSTFGGFPSLAAAATEFGPALRHPYDPRPGPRPAPPPAWPTPRSGGRSPRRPPGALHALYGNYAEYDPGWIRRESDHPSATTPPVFIVICSNMAVSKLVFDYIAGWERVLGAPAAPAATERRRGAVPVRPRRPRFRDLADAP
jgi:hypothetical protein